MFEISLQAIFIILVCALLGYIIGRVLVSPHRQYMGGGMVEVDGRPLIRIGSCLVRLVFALLGAGIGYLVVTTLDLK